MKKTKISVLSLALVATIIFSGCGSSGYSSASTASYEPSAYATEEMAYDTAAEYVTTDAKTSSSENVSENASATNRKLIKTVSMDVETKEFDALLANIDEQIKSAGGYVESSNVSNNNYYSTYRANNRSANFVIRVPQNKLDDFVARVKGFSNVTSMSQSVQDVTLTYVDLKAHKESLETEYDRLLELLANADDLEQIIIIEERLSDIRYQIESMESQLRTFDNQVDYSTIHLYIDEVGELTVVDPETDGERLSRMFVENWISVITGLKEFGINFVAAIPFILVWAIFIGIIVLIVRACVKASKKKKQKALLKRQQQMMNQAPVTPQGNAAPSPQAPADTTPNNQEK